MKQHQEVSRCFTQIVTLDMHTLLCLLVPISAENFSFTPSQERSPSLNGEASPVIHISCLSLKSFLECLEVSKFKKFTLRNHSSSLDVCACLYRRSRNTSRAKGWPVNFSSRSNSLYSLGEATDSSRSTTNSVPTAMSCVATNSIVTPTGCSNHIVESFSTSSPDPSPFV